jgi:hypothetical protein
VHWMIALGVGGLAACLLAPSTARAADTGFCNDHAHAAVDQIRFARSMPRCAPGTYGPRLSMDFRGHYDWCLGARYRDAQFDRGARHDYIEGCRHP